MSDPMWYVTGNAVEENEPGLIFKVMVKWARRSYMHATWHVPETLAGYKGASALFDPPPRSMTPTPCASPASGVVRRLGVRDRPGYKKVENFVRKIEELEDLKLSETK